MGLTALSLLSAMTRFTPQSMAASMTFLAPMTFVWIASKGLYSQTGICLSAAACTTTSTSCIARTSRSRSRTSPIKKRRRESLNLARISDCFSSSRLKTTRRRGRCVASTISTNLFPKEPVPPVTRIEALARSIGFLSRIERQELLCGDAKRQNVWGMEPRLVEGGQDDHVYFHGRQFPVVAHRHSQERSTGFTRKDPDRVETELLEREICQLSCLTGPVECDPLQPVLRQMAESIPKGLPCQAIERQRAAHVLVREAGLFGDPLRREQVAQPFSSQGLPGKFCNLDVALPDQALEVQVSEPEGNPKALGQDALARGMPAVDRAEDFQLPASLALQGVHKRSKFEHDRGRGVNVILPQLSRPRSGRVLPGNPPGGLVQRRRK